MNTVLANQLLTDHALTNHLPASPPPASDAETMIDVLTTHALTTHSPAIPSLDADSADPAPPFLRPTSEPWLACGFLAAGHVTVLTGDAHESPLALA